MTENVSLHFWVNGIPVAASAGKLTLLRFLRDELRLTGTKNGCSTNHCGACMVLVDDTPVKSCALPLSRLEGKRVVTIEGLTRPGELSPLQAAFLAAGAVQCGFCTPGMIVATHGLLLRYPNPTEDQIRDGLRHNICRCTGYVKIIDAVRLAARWLRFPGEITLPDGLGLGVSAPDYDGAGKVDGSLAFADDLYLDNMVYGKIVWSRYPHAEITAVDTSAAAAMPGVAAVFTAKDVPGHNGVGSLVADQPVLCKDRVRFVGDIVAVVFAGSPTAAAAAAQAVKVDYRELPGVFSPQAGLKPDAPRLHPNGNVSKYVEHEVGDIDAGFRLAAVVAEGHFETPFVEHAYLEPEAGVGFIDETGRITVKSPTQFPFEMRRQLAAVLGLPEESVRVIVAPVGGAFGSKLDNTVEALLALGAYHLRRPVKLTLTREESLKLSTKRHPYWLDYRVGVAADGKIVAIDARLLSDAGPYTALSPRVIDQAGLFSCGPYFVPNFKVEGWAVHTNNANGSAFRGFGINQAAVAVESLLDECAVRLGMDPFDLRLTNALKPGDPTISGEVLRTSVAIAATITAAKKALQKDLPWIASLRSAGKKIGVGMASGFKNVGAGKGKVDDAGAIFSLKQDGKIELRASAVDLGQGIRVALVQIAAEILGSRPGLIDIITGDTALTLRHGGVVGERQVLINGKAVEIAARQFREAILQKTAELTGVPLPDLRLEHDKVLTGDRAVMTLAELADEAGSLEVSHYYVAPKTYAFADKEARRTVPVEEYRNYPAYAYTTQVAIVEVDESTGRVKVLKVIAAHDCGKAINPQKIEGQIEGSCLQGQGYALSRGILSHRRRSPDKDLPVARRPHHPRRPGGRNDYHRRSRAERSFRRQGHIGSRHRSCYPGNTERDL